MEYIECLDLTQGATITIYADQPVNDTNWIINTAGSVGHAFISIQQGNNIATLGFYPQSTLGSVRPNLATPDPTDFLSTPGIFGNDENHSFDVSLSVPIDSSSLNSLINGFISAAEGNPMYNLGSNNCTDIAIIAFEAASNIDIPNCESPRPYWNGQTPATLGEKLRNMTTPTGGTKNTTGGNSPNNNYN